MEQSRPISVLPPAPSRNLSGGQIRDDALEARREAFQLLIEIMYI
jgi:hypothetical protein